MSVQDVQVKQSVDSMDPTVNCSVLLTNSDMMTEADKSSRHYKRYEEMNNNVALILATRSTRYIKVVNAFMIRVVITHITMCCVVLCCVALMLGPNAKYISTCSL